MIQFEVKTPSSSHICEAEGCFAVAEAEIKVPVGQVGEINLSVCTNCKPNLSRGTPVEAKCVFVMTNIKYGLEKSQYSDFAGVAAHDQSMRITVRPPQRSRA
jgi:hypothetical protein